MLRILTDSNAVVEHSRPDGEYKRRWALNDLDGANSSSSWQSTPSTLDLSTWVCVRWREDDKNCWMVPRDNLRLSAGVPLKTIRPRAVISSHVGEVLLLQRYQRLSFISLSSFIDGLRAVRPQFERELEEGRRAASTAEERISNLRKCRDRMNAYSDQVVTEHMKVLPVEWKNGGAAGKLFERILYCAVLHLTTPDGRLVDGEDETNVAVVGDDRHIIVRVREDGHIDAEWNKDNGKTHSMSPAGGSKRLHTRAFGQTAVTSVVNMIRYVRDSDSQTDAIQMSELLNSDGVGRREMLWMSRDSGATGRWLVFVTDRCNDVTVFDTETGKMANLTAPSVPSGAMETSEGLWMWGYAVDRWSTLFKVEALQSLAYKDPSIFNEPAELVQRRVVDETLDAAAFCESYRSGTNRIDRHPGHYWVVAGYGPVPASLRASDHIYKELETFEQLKRYEGFPFWFADTSTPPSFVEETGEAPWSPIWAGAVDLRDGVTAETIKEHPKTDAWHVAVPTGREPSGEFLVTGDALSALSPFATLELPVKAGRWLWRVHSDGHNVAELTLRHESVSEVDIPKCKKPMRFLHSRRLKHCLTQLGALAPVIPEEGLRAKIAEFGEWVYTSRILPCTALALLDKSNAAGWCMLIESSDGRVVPSAGGVAFDSGCGCLALLVGENVFRVLEVRSLRRRN